MSSIYDRLEGIHHELSHYLRAAITVGQPELTVIKGSMIKKYVSKITIEVSNEAQETVGWPKIVFTRVGLTIRCRPTHPDFRNRYVSTGVTQVSNPCTASPSGNNAEGLMRVGASGEQLETNMPTLLPGQKMVYTISAPTEIVSRLHFHLEYNLSRRYLTHFEDEIELPNREEIVAPEIPDPRKKTTENDTAAKASKFEPEKNSSSMQGNPSKSTQEATGQTGEEDDGTWSDDEHQRTSKDDRSDSMNPNNDAYHAAMDNHANQMNPNNEAYWASRGR